MNSDMLFYRDKNPGADKTIFFLHGLFGNSLNFSGIVAEFDNSFRIINFDLRNHGQSFHSDEMDYEKMADDVARFILKNNIYPQAIIGHSMGGKVLMTYLLKKLPAFDKFVPIVLDIFPNTSPQQNIKEMAEVMNNINFEEITDKEEVCKLFKTVESNPQVISFMMTNLVAGNHFSWRINTKAIYENIDAIVSFPRLNTTHDLVVHLIYAELSPYYSTQSKADMLKLFPKTKFYCIQNARHWVHFDQKKAVVSLLKKILPVQ